MFDIGESQRLIFSAALSVLCLTVRNTGRYEVAGAIGGAIYVGYNELLPEGLVSVLLT